MTAPAKDLRKITVNLPTRDIEIIDEAAKETASNRTASLIRLLRIAGHIDKAQRNGHKVLITDDDGNPVEVQFV